MPIAGRRSARESSDYGSDSSTTGRVRQGSSSPPDRATDDAREAMDALINNQYRAALRLDRGPHF
jgi:hypothetical protein